MMPERTVKRDETVRLGRVEGDLKVGHNATIGAESDGRLVVTGTVVFDGGATVDCSLECGSIEVRATRHTGGTIKVNGDLLVTAMADVADSLEVSGIASAQEFDVGGHLKANSVNAKRMRVGGHLKVKDSLESESVDVAGHLTALGKVKIVDLHVGGHAKIGGGTISGSIQVRGHFETKTSLSYGEFQSFGHVTLPAGSKGDRLSVFGRVDFGGDASCKVMEVKGVAEVNGNFSADQVDVLGKLRVTKSLKVSSDLKVAGVADVEDRVDCGKLMVEGKLNAESALAAVEADLSGEVKTVRGVRSKVIVVRRCAKVTGPLVGDRVEVGEKPAFGQWPSVWAGKWTRMGQMTSVEDVYGSSVKIGPYSAAKRVFADSVEMENSSIAEEVTYTREIKLTPKNYIHKAPLKVGKLPDAPA